MSFLCLILLLWHTFGVVNEPDVFLCCHPRNTSGVWVQSTNPVGLTEVGLKLLTGGHVWGRWEQWRLPGSRYRGREELQYLWGAGSCSQGCWGAQTQCGVAAHRAVRSNAQSTNRWEVGRSSPCLLASYLQSLNMEGKEVADAFSPFCLFVAYLGGIKRWSECNVKCCYENLFVCTHLDGSVQCATWWSMLLLLSLRDEKNEEGVSF